MNFADRLCQAVRDKGTPLVVGIDPRPEQFPQELQLPATAPVAERLDQVRLYCREIIEAVADLVPAVKPQAAFFESLGPGGCQVLAETVVLARERGLIVVMDAKRGDIGSTAEAYAQAYLGADSPWGCDSLTVNPFLGDDTLDPFVRQAQQTNSGLFVLAHTSNPGSRWIQDRAGDPEAVYQMVADHLQRLSAETRGECGYGIVGAVVGATYPQQLMELRQRMPYVLFLIPGFGAQGGTAADVQAGLDSHGLGALINSSRGIIQAYQQPAYRQLEWTAAVRQATLDSIEQLAIHTSAGALRKTSGNGAR